MFLLNLFPPGSLASWNFLLDFRTREDYLDHAMDMGITAAAAILSISFRQYTFTDRSQHKLGRRPQLRHLKWDSSGRGRNNQVVGTKLR